jgi:hypothetical protein
MKKLLFLLILATLLMGCWEHNDSGWGNHHYTLTLTVSSECHHSPFRVYVDGRDSSDKVGEIGEAGGTLVISLESGTHSIYVRDDDGNWIYDNDIHLDDDRSIEVYC